jgi:hypothetical protein
MAITSIATNVAGIKRGNVTVPALVFRGSRFLERSRNVPAPVQATAQDATACEHPISANRPDT